MCRLDMLFRVTWIGGDRMSHQRVAWVVLGLTHFLFTQTTTPGGRVPGPQPSQGGRKPSKPASTCGGCGASGRLAGGLCRKCRK